MLIKDLPHDTALACSAHLLDALTNVEIEKWPSVMHLLEIKKADGSPIDIRAMSIYYGLSEMQSRRLINKYEYNSGLTFIIINGSDAWKEQDELRLAKISQK